MEFIKAKYFVPVFMLVLLTSGVPLNANNDGDILPIADAVVQTKDNGNKIFFCENNPIDKKKYDRPDMKPQDYMSKCKERTEGYSWGSRIYVLIWAPGFDADGQIIHQWKGAFDPVSEDTINLVESTIQGTSYQSSEPTILTDGLVAGFAIAFSAGVLSFLSPCVLPLIPVYASLITGLSAKELSQNTSQTTRSKLRLTATVKGIMFVIGFSIVFMLLGTTVSFMGNLFFDSIQWIERIGGVVLIVLGLHMIGLFKIPRLEKQIRFDMAKRNSGKFGPLVVGMAFGAGWTPCIGPILAGILTIAASSSSVVTGASLLGVYSLGLAIPFLVSAIAIDRFLVFFTKIKSKMLWIEKISGMLFVIFGIVLLTGSLVYLNNFFKMSF